MYCIKFNFKKIALGVCTHIIAGLSCFTSYSQDQKAIDSLKVIVEKNSGAEKSDALLRLAIEHMGWNNPTALTYANESQQIAMQIGDSLRIIKSKKIKGRVYRGLDNLQGSIKEFTEGLAIAERNSTDKMIFEEYKAILNGIAITYTYFADYDKALEYNFKCLEIWEREGNKGEMSIILNNIGLVYFKLRNYPTALKYYRQSLGYKMESKDYFDLDRLYINIGLCYNQIKDFEESQKNFELAFGVCKEQCSDQIRIEGEFGIGVAYFGQDKFEEALRHFNISHDIAKEIRNKRFMGENLVYIGKVNVAQHKTELAIQALKEAEVLASNGGYNELLIDVFRQFSTLYNQSKDFENAAIYQSKYIHLKDSIYSNTLIENIAKIQTNYAERENIKKIADKDEQIQRQRTLSLAIIIIAILATLLVFVLYRGNQVKKKVNAALSEAKTIIEDQNRQLLSSNYNLDKELKVKNYDLEKAIESLRKVNDELDNFIYKTSHDIRGPLASLKGMCNVALMDVKDPTALSYLKKLDITAEKLNTILTRLLIVNQINNSVLASEKIDFNSIVSDVLLLEKKKGLPSRLKVRRYIDDDIEFYSDKEFVRIILENLIDNAIKFYNDSDRIEPFVDIYVSMDENSVRIKVIDNGIGISEVHPDKIFQMFSRASERSETGGIGLYITKTATEKLGGSVNLKTTPEGFTEFSVKLPVSMVRVMAS